MVLKYGDGFLMMSNVRTGNQILNQKRSKSCISYFLNYKKPNTNQLLVFTHPPLPGLLLLELSSELVHPLLYLQLVRRA